MARLPLVNYLSLEDSGLLTGVECTECSARFVDLARPACGSCGALTLRPVTLARTGSVRTFTVVHRTTPGVPVPFISAVVDLDDGGPSVRANLLHVEPAPESVPRDLRVELELVELGSDSAGDTAVGYGFRPTDLAPKGVLA